jgi:thioredoxin reductase (NADPH)
MNKKRRVDCLIVGAGPAGLTTAIYLARFRRTLALIDEGFSRAALIPTSHNLPGYPEGIAGPKLLELLREQARRYGATVESGTVSDIASMSDGAFRANVEMEPGAREIVAETVVLATGVSDVEPALPNLEHAIRLGYVRHCPVCDGFEIIDRNIAVIGYGASGLKEAMFLRTYTKEVTLLTLGERIRFSDEDLAQVRDAAIRVIESPVSEVFIEKNRIVGLRFEDDSERKFDTLYSALGCCINSALARKVGARTDEAEGTGAVIVDAHQRTSVPGLYAAGDVVLALNQIAVAYSGAAIAATQIHNALPKRHA